MKAVLFDCDGTIADSAGLIVAIMDRAFRRFDLDPPPPEATRAIIGLSLEKAVHALRPSLDERVVVDLAEGYRIEYRAERARPDFSERLFPGMAELVRALAARDEVFVGMVTGKSRRGVAALTAHHGLSDCFHAVRTADDCPSKPHPAMVLECCAEFGIAPEAAVVVGDTTFDMEMARAAGSRAVGVAWGSHSPELMRRAGAHEIVAETHALGAALERFLAD
ncbi:HAD-IA family hydrolase [Jiella sonneratiae]|uniref:HAD-IA family hydrolase n=1 Tax=Jiella sonneratiae TaxID=2816856 RepID=A0ABS3IYL3_9HYPH|nr:HAD-IA family hydrolase [Jiella sonneratiae]MBO0902495.1 HAD-IA family hydrolase [Jiella sonneratiae]